MTEEQYSSIIKSLNELSIRIDKIESLITKTETALPKTISSSNPGIKNLAEKIGTEENDIHNFLHFEEDSKFHLLFNITGRNESEKQLKGTLIILTISHYCYGVSSILSKELVRKLETMRIKSLDHINHTLKKSKRYIVFSGKRGDPNSSYTITMPGLDEGIKIIKQFYNTIEGEISYE